jgi:cytochrome c oxidase assembly protein subunit 15
MASEAPRLRLRGRGVLGALIRPERFGMLVVVVFAAVYVNIVAGAFVRLTNSGLGCPDWPACRGGPVPPLNFHAIAEYTNRVMAFCVIVTTVLLAVSAYRGVRHTHPAWYRLAVWVAAGTLAEGPLGGVTIATGLNPVVVMSHFLLAVAVFCAATVLLVDVHGAPGVASSRPRWLKPAVFVLSGWAFALITSGAVVTMSSTHPGADNVPRLWNLLDATYWHVRIAVSFVVVLAAFLYATTTLEVTNRRVPRAAWVVVGLTGAQIVIGEWQWRHQLPWYAVLLHVSCAAALWAAVITLARSLLPAAASIDARALEQPASAPARSPAGASTRPS